MKNKEKVITIFNKKGGVGKTSLAYSLAKDLGYALLSNDDSVIEKIYPKKAKIIKEIRTIPHNAIYDLGGYIDKGITALFQKSDLVIVPTLLDSNSVKRTKNTIIELLKLKEISNNNLMIVVNRARKEKIFGQRKKLLSILEALEVKIQFIRESKVIPNSMLGMGSISDQFNKTGLSKHTYKGVFGDYEKVLNSIKKEEE